MSFVITAKFQSNKTELVFGDIFLNFPCKEKWLFKNKEQASKALQILRKQDVFTSPIYKIQDVKKLPEYLKVQIWEL